MHITVACPHCQSVYQVEPSLQGRLMRCPNPLCRKTFEVKELTLAPIEEESNGPAPRPPPSPSPGEEGGGRGGADSPKRERPDRGAPVRPDTTHQTGSVGDLIPLLPAEAAPEPPPWDIVPLLQAEPLPPAELPPPTEAPSWQQPPPVRRPQRTDVPRSGPPLPHGRGSSAAPTQITRRPKHEPRPRPAPVVQVPLAAPAAPPAPLRGLTPPAPTVPGTAGQPTELPPGVWEPPPVRRPQGTDVPHAEPPPAEEPPAHADAELVPGTAARRRARWLMAILGLFMLAVLGGAGWFAWSVWVANEGRLRDQGRHDYQEGRFVEAAGKFRTLAEKFPESTDLPEYQFLAALSELRGAMQGVGVNPAEQMERAAQFLNRHAQSPLLKQYGPDLGQSLVRLLNDLAAGAAQSGKADDRAALDRAEQLLAETEQRAPGSVSAGDRGKLAEAFATARGAIEQRERQQQFLDRLHALAAAPSADAVKEAHRLIQRESAQQPGVERDPAVQQALAQLYEGHRGRVVYIPAGIDVDQKGRRAEAVEPSLLVDPLVAGHPGAMAGEDRTVLALARGVLYALSRNTGQVQWAMRVGIDTEELPLRVPPTLANPERFLVLSADSNTLTALDADGVRLWQYPLTAPCLGRPVVVDQRAFVPTYDGQVHEIELVRGHLLGRYNLGQRLSVGGARQPGTHLLYFPADDYCVYVLNVDPKLPPPQRRCEAVLYSRHPSGSLRSEPILAAWENPAGPPQGYLILPRAQGLDAVELQTYGLPLGAPDARPLPMEPAPRVRGWTWFPPYHDPEKLALATDAGMFALFGIRQLRNQDAPLFRVLHEEAKGGPALHTALGRRGRSQVVHVQENDFWVLAQGRLQRLRLTFDRQKGPHVVAVWEQAVPLGSPLHVSQVDETPEAGLGLLVVTQALGRQTCLATMVDAEDGRIRWQRQLGLVCQGDPLCLGHEVLAVDQGGGLFRFDPDRHPHLTNRPWQIGGANVARPLESRDRQGAAGTSRPYLLPAADGKSAYEIAPTGKGTSLAVRHYSLGGEAKQTALDEHVIELRAALAGPPALAGDALLLPLADGSLHRLHLPLDGSAGVDGPDWRTTRSLAELRPFVVGLGPDEFLTSDGIGGLTRWRWPRGGVWQALPKNKDPRRPTLALPARIVSAPVVLPADGKGEQRICVADAEGTVYLLQTKGDVLEVAQRWRAGAGGVSPLSAATAGPFVRDGKIGCVVERKRLVWIDPAQEQPVWEYRADEEIVGQPQLVDGLLVLADQSGKFVALDPATGRPRGPGYRLRANVAPAASPVAFGEGRAFAPLTDGTVFLLPLDRLGDPLRGFPLFW